MRRELIGRAQKGDHEAFEALTSPAIDRLYGVARRILRDGSQADDAVQECLIRAWRDIRALRDLDRFDAWLHRLLVHSCRDESRRQRRRTIEVHVLPLDRPGGDDASAGLADRDELERGFRRLSVDQRSVLVLHYYLGLTAPEIASTLGLRVGTVYSRLHYATSALRAVLEADARPALVANGGRTA
jgi:RNA polymerase sigma-70 factor (ECF subfamily)